jgi:Uma2 family endonuclease
MLFLLDVKVATLISLEEYLDTSYSPDREYRDGELIERNVGEAAHASLQAGLGAYFHGRRRQWKILTYASLRVKVREKWYPIPDVCIYPAPKFEGRYPDKPPLLWVEILSHDDRMVDVWAKADELVSLGVPYVWIIDPNTLTSELRTPAGILPIENRTLRIPNTPIVIPLDEVMEQ